MLEYCMKQLFLVRMGTIIENFPKLKGIYDNVRKITRHSKS